MFLVCSIRARGGNRRTYGLGQHHREKPGGTYPHRGDAYRHGGKGNRRHGGAASAVSLPRGLPIVATGGIGGAPPDRRRGARAQGETRCTPSNAQGSCFFRKRGGGGQMAFQLFDTRQRFSRTSRRRTFVTVIPRIHVFTDSPLVPLFQTRPVESPSLSLSLMTPSTRRASVTASLRSGWRWRTCGNKRGVWRAGKPGRPECKNQHSCRRSAPVRRPAIARSLWKKSTLFFASAIRRRGTRYSMTRPEHSHHASSGGGFRD